MNNKDKLQKLENELFELDVIWEKRSKLNLNLAKEICLLQEKINDILVNKKIDNDKSIT